MGLSDAWTETVLRTVKTKLAKTRRVKQELATLLGHIIHRNDATRTPCETKFLCNYYVTRICLSTSSCSIPGKVRTDCMNSGTPALHGVAVWRQRHFKSHVEEADLRTQISRQASCACTHEPLVRSVKFHGLPAASPRGVGMQPLLTHLFRTTVFDYIRVRVWARCPVVFGAVMYHDIHAMLDYFRMLIFVETGK